MKIRLVSNLAILITARENEPYMYVSIFFREKISLSYELKCAMFHLSKAYKFVCQLLIMPFRGIKNSRGVE
jgi:hypothetical protein